MIKTYTGRGLMPVIKFFPGSYNHLTTYPVPGHPEIDISASELSADLAPYQQLLTGNEPPSGVLVTHALYPQIDSQPVSRSPRFIQDIIRNEYGYQGLVIVDDLSLLPNQDPQSLADYLSQSLKSGSDLFIWSDSISYPEVLNLLENQIDADPALKEALNTALARILNTKSRLLPKTN